LSVRFRLGLSRRHPDRLTTLQAPIARLVVVRNSSGIHERRPLLEAIIRLGQIVKPIRLTLTHRVGMRFPMILGRQALTGSFVVDVGKKYLLRV
jgi:hypothetical protein